MKINPKFLRIKGVTERVGLSRSQIYKLISQGRFPAQIKLYGSVAAWLESDITEWIEQQVAASKAAA